jgi:hypothetical protein
MANTAGGVFSQISYNAEIETTQIFELHVLCDTQKKTVSGTLRHTQNNSFWQCLFRETVPLGGGV